MESGHSRADLKKLNYVRKYLKVVTLADITTSDGKKLSHESYLCERGKGLRNDLKWPRVPSTLPRPFITLWKKALREIFIIPYANENNRRLLRELGPWTDHNVEDKYILYFAKEENRVYRRSIDGWLMYFSARRRRGGATCRHDGIVVDNKPATATIMVSMGVRGVTGTGGLYTVETLALWLVTSTLPTTDYLLRGPSDSILSQS